jgi:hypothetical protein
MPINLKPNEQVIVAATAITLVYAIYSQTVPNLADVRADQPGNTNTHAATKMAAVTSVAVVGALSLLAHSPTVFTVGGGMILFETWKYHAANYGINGAQQNNQNVGY